MKCICWLRYSPCSHHCFAPVHAILSSDRGLAHTDTGGATLPAPSIAPIHPPPPPSSPTPTDDFGAAVPTIHGWPNTTEAKPSEVLDPTGWKLLCGLHRQGSCTYAPRLPAQVGQVSINLERTPSDLDRRTRDLGDRRRAWGQPLLGAPGG